ncbi:hypothetical protein Tco_0393131, partial [Tanacetum coccineum]
MLCKPKPYYNEQNKVAIGYKNPLCLTRAKQVRPALYNGYEIIKNNHVSALVHNTKDTLEIAEITRRKMNDKMKDPEYVTHKVKIAPLDYSKENYLATFTPQKQLTPKKIFCPTIDQTRCLKLEAELSKLRDKVQKDDHTELVKRFSNLEVNHLNLQLKYQNLKESFGNNPSPPARDTLDFDLVFVIGKMKASIQGKDNAIKKLRTQISQLKETRSEADRTLGFRTLDFQITQLTEKVIVLQEQNELFRAENEKVKHHYKELYDSIKITRAKHIEQTTALLTKNKNLKAQIHENLKCNTMESVKPRVLAPMLFTEMHETHTIVQTRCLELEAEISKLRDKVQKDDHTELVKRFSNLKITQLTEKVTVLQEQNELFRAENEKVKQHYKELYDSIKITRAKHIEQTTALLTENENLKAQIHENLKCNTMESVKPRVLEPFTPHNRNNREVHLHYLKHLKESVETLREIVEEAKVERPLDRSLASACLYTKHSQELLEYVIGTCPKDFNQRDKKHAPTPLIRKKQVTFEEQCDTSNSNTHKHVEQLNTQKTNVPVPPSTGVNSRTDASGSQPRSNTKKNRISPAKGVNKTKVEENPITNKSNFKT